MTRERARRRAAAELTVTVSSTRRRDRAAGELGRWLERAAPARARGGVAIALISDARMRRLNRTFRGVDRATDVLSFRAEEDAETSALPPGVLSTGVDKAGTVRSIVRLANGQRTPASRRPRLAAGDPAQRRSKSLSYSHLGDIAIATGVATRQARAEGHSPETELKILALHGLLHLLGYDHERDRGAMSKMEERLRRRAGLPAGLIARAPRRTAYR